MSKTSMLKISAQSAAKVSLWCVQVPRVALSAFQRNVKFTISQFSDRSCSRNLLEVTDLVSINESSPRGWKKRKRMSWKHESATVMVFILFLGGELPPVAVSWGEPRGFISFFNEWNVYSEQAAWPNFGLFVIFRLEICSQSSSHRRSHSWTRCSGCGLYRPLLSVGRLSHLCFPVLL